MMFNNNDKKTHYKMYKAGKHWLFASLTLISIGLGAGFFEDQSLLAQADTNQQENNPSSEKGDADDNKDSASMATKQQSSPASNSIKEAQQATLKPASINSKKDELTSKLQDPQETIPSTKSTEQPVENSSQAESQPAGQAVSHKDIPQNSAATRTKKQVTPQKPAAPQNEQVKNKQVSPQKELSYQDLLSELKQTNNNYSHVNKDNFLDYFILNGDATYDPQTGIVTLTPNENNQVGNFTLKNKINLDYNFKLTGSINLGSDKNGADGIGLAFHNGNTNDVGISGGNNGIAGLENAFGFKLDTWHNDYQAPNPNGNSASDKFGWDKDPNTLGQPFGGFVETSKKHPGNDPSNPETWWAETAQNMGTAGYQILNKDIIDGQFHNFTIDYDGQKHVMTLTLQGNGQSWQWSKAVNLGNFDNNLAAFMMAASTGGAKNLHQFQIDSFDYVASKKAEIRYIDQTTGQELHADHIEGMIGEKVNYSTDKMIQNYKEQGYELVSDDLASGKYFDTDVLTEQVFNIYLSHGSQTIIDKSKAVTNTVHFIDKNGNELLNPQNEALTFEHSYTIDKVTGQKIQDSDSWTPAQTFGNFTLPKIVGYHTDTEVIPSRTVTHDSTDITSYIIYSKDVEPVEPGEPGEPGGSTKPATPTANDSSSVAENPQVQEDINSERQVTAEITHDKTVGVENNSELLNGNSILKTEQILKNESEHNSFSTKPLTLKTNKSKLVHLILTDLPHVYQVKNQLVDPTANFYKINSKNSLTRSTKSGNNNAMPPQRVTLIKASSNISQREIYQQNQAALTTFERQLKKIQKNNPNPKKNSVTSLGNYLQTMSGKVIAGTVKN